MKKLILTAAISALCFVNSGTTVHAMDDHGHHDHHHPTTESVPLNMHDHHGLHTDEAGLFVLKPYAFATAKMQKNGAIFFDIHNHLEDNDRLIGVSSDVSDVIEMHTHSHEDGIMKMREVENYFIPAKSALTFEPMGHHIMLIGLKSQLEEGQSFPLTLTFEKAGKKTLNVMIVKPGEKAHNH